MRHYKVVARRTKKPDSSSDRSTVREGVLYNVTGTVPVQDDSNDVPAYVGDARVELTIRRAGELLVEQGASRVEIIVRDPRFKK